MAWTTTVPRKAAVSAIAWKPWAQRLFIAAVTLLVLAPIAMVVLDGFNVAPTGVTRYQLGITNWLSMFSDRSAIQALKYTVEIVGIRGVLGFVIAIPLAWLVARSNVPGAQWLEFGFWASFFMPSLASIQGWIFLLEGRTGLVNQWIQMLPFVKTSPFDVYGFWGIIWVHLMSQNVSALFVLLVVGFRNMDSALEEAARTCGATRWKLVREITLPLARPLIAMMVVLAIIRGLQSYEVEQVLGLPAGINVYSTLIVRMLNNEPPNIPEGSALSTLMLLLLIPLIIIQRAYVGGRQYTTVSSRMRPTQVDLGRWRWVVFGGITALLMLMTVVPLVSVVIGSLMRRWGYFALANPWTLNNWQTVLGDSNFTSSLANTLVIGVVAGLVSSITCFLIAYTLVRTRASGRGMLDFVSWLPWAIPGVLLSLGLLRLVLSIPPFRILYGSLLMLILAIVLFGFPLGVQFMKTGLMQISKELEEASLVCGSGWLQSQRKIHLPILMPMFLAVFLITFVTAINEISAVVLLASTDTRTLSLLSLGYIAGSVSSKESAACVTTVMIVLSLGVAFLARLFGVRMGGGGLGAAPREVAASETVAQNIPA